jgi:pimeloyl-ACP methyl ester carboxylesterase
VYPARPGPRRVAHESSVRRNAGRGPRRNDPAPYDPRVKIEGKGRPLVLVPGMDGTGELFYRQLPTLIRDHRVATYRLRDSATDMGTLIDDLAGIVAAVSPEGAPATIVGESFGGALAMSFAVSRPELIDELVVLNSFPRFTPQVRLQMALHGLRILPWGAMRLVRRATAFRMHSRYTNRAAIRRFLELSRGITKEGYLNRLRILRGYDLRDRLGEIGARTLFLAADLDHLVPSVEQARLMVASVPQARLRILEGHGHICLIAPNLDLAALLEDWRRETSSTSGVDSSSTSSESVTTR